MSHFVLPLICVAVGLMTAIETARAADIDPVRSAIGRYIQPNFERFADLSELLTFSISDLCEEPKEQTLREARFGFSAAARAWARVEFVRAGPLSESNKADRILFWPDRRGTGLRQIQAVLVNADESVLTVTQLEKKSVALQGFGALEFLLFGSGSDTLLDKSSSFRCSFAVAVARNIHTISRQILADWEDDTGFVDTWLSPSESNAAYRSEKESLGELVGTLAHGFEMIRDQRLKPIAPGFPRPPSHKRALFWRSNGTIAMIRASLEAMQNLFFVSGLTDILPHEKRWLGGSIVFEFSNAQKTLDAISLPIDEAVYVDDQAAKLSYLIVVTRSLQRLIGEEYASAVQLATGFSPLDGD